MKTIHELEKEIEERKKYLKSDVDVKRILPKGTVFRIDLEYNKLKATLTQTKEILEMIEDEIEGLKNLTHGGMEISFAQGKLKELQTKIKGVSE